MFTQQILEKKYQKGLKMVTLIKVKRMKSYILIMRNMKKKNEDYQLKKIGTRLVMIKKMKELLIYEMPFVKTQNIVKI